MILGVLLTAGFIGLYIMTKLGTEGKAIEQCKKHKVMFDDLGAVYDKQVTYTARLKRLFVKLQESNTQIGVMLHHLFPYMQPEGRAKVQEVIGNHDEVIKSLNEAIQQFYASQQDVVDILRR